MTTEEVRGKFLDFYESKGHKIIPSASLVPEDDPTTLFTGSGMQPMLPYLLGERHPLGTRIVDSQKCFRAQDIEEIGDNRHTTFFEMLGNWSLGDYFKKEQLEWLFEFLTDSNRGVGLNPSKLYVTVFAGNKNIPPDTQTVKIWQRLFKDKGIYAKELDSAEKSGMRDGRIFYYGSQKNWWSRTGAPDTMPKGEPGGPDSEVFFDFGEELGMHEKSGFKDRPCHPNCECGRFLEIGNSVFMMYKKTESSDFEDLPNKNIDFGGGLERIVAATENIPDIFLIDSFKVLIQNIEEASGKRYKEGNKAHMRLIADHLKGITFLICDGVRPSNKDQGYFLRRLLRRGATSFYILTGNMLPTREIKSVVNQVIKFYDKLYFDTKNDISTASNIIEEELKRFNQTLKRGLKEIEKVDLNKINGDFVFNLYQSCGLPFEITREVLAKQGYLVSHDLFEKAFKRHQDISRRGAKKKFAGGLIDHSEKVVKLHTATHLLHQALRDILGKHVQQKGSNITKDRLRFDFTHKANLTQDEITQVENIVNQKIKENLNVWSEVLDREKAIKIGALAFFREKYIKKVKVYFIGKKGERDSAYSKELCAGPHANSTRILRKFKIIKECSAGAGIRRIYAILE